MSSPDSVLEFIGNRRLATSLLRRSLPGAALFEGPDGVGKRTLALLLASLANCLSPDREAGRPCGRCPSCLKAASGNHPDIRIIGPEKDSVRIRIDQMRDMSREAQFLPFEGKGRFFVIDPADRLQPEAAHAILKTLEEPPETTHIVLITAFPDQILTTIRSRCLIFPFLPVPRAELADMLRTRPDIDHPELRAAFARGSVGAALDLNPQEMAEQRDLMLDLLADWLKKRRFGVVLAHSANKALKLRDRQSVLQYLSLLQDLCYDLYYLLARTPERVINLDRRGRMEKLKDLTSIEELRALLKAIADARRDVDRNVKIDLCFETMWLFEEIPAAGGPIPERTPGLY